MEYPRPLYDSFEDQPPTDQELADRIHAGDDTAFNELWQRHQGAVENIARGTGANWHDGEDLAQEAAIKLWRDLQKHPRDLSGNGARNLAGTIITRTAIDEHRKRRRRPEELVDEVYDRPDTATPSAEAVVVRTQIHEIAARMLQSALSELSTEFAEAFLATNVEEGIRQEYARQTGIKVGTIASRNSRAKAALMQRPELRDALYTLDAE